MKGRERDAHVYSGNASLAVSIGTLGEDVTCMHIDEDGAWVKREVNIDAPDDPELRLSVNGQTRWRIYTRTATAATR